MAKLCTTTKNLIKVAIIKSIHYIHVKFSKYVCKNHCNKVESLRYGEVVDFYQRLTMVCSQPSITSGHLGGSAGEVYNA